MDRQDKALLAAITAAALALCAVIAATRPKETEAPPVIAPVDTQPIQTQEPEATAASSSSNLWSDDGSLHRLKPLDVDLDAETQWAIYRACNYDPGLFCLVMAIVDHESGFDPQTVGDYGDSIGIMQINVKWHTGRMETEIREVLIYSVY